MPSRARDGDDTSTFDDHQVNNASQPTMPRLIGLGNNICHALDPSASAKPTLRAPTGVGSAESIQHHDWTCTVASSRSISSTTPSTSAPAPPVAAWGDDPLVSSLRMFEGPISRILKTQDRPAALLSKRRIHLPPPWEPSTAEWDDVAATDLGPAVGFRRESRPCG